MPHLVARFAALPGSTPGQPVHCLAIAAARIDDHAIAVTAESSGTVRLWDLSSGHERQVFAQSSGRILDVAIMETGPIRPVVLAAGLGGVHFWDPATGDEVEVRQGSCGTSFSAAHVLRPRPGRPDGLLLADVVGGLECWAGARLLRWRLPLAPNNEPIFTVTSFEADRRIRVATHVEGLLVIVDAVWGRVLEEHRIGQQATSYGMSVLYGDRAPYLVVALGEDIVVWDIARRREQYRWRVGSAELKRVAVMESNGGPRIVTLSEDGLVSVFEPRGDLVTAYDLPGPASALTAVAHHVVAVGYEGGWGLLKLV